MGLRHRFMKRLVFVAVCVSCSAAVGAAAHAAGTGNRDVDHLVLYSVTEQEQYVNNQDDRTRGKGNNPFGNYKDSSPITGKSTDGPFPGDEAIFTFDLYTAPDLKTHVGSAVFTCQYNFQKNAFCDASFQLASGGTLIAEGGFGFAANTFTLAVTGSYGPLVNKRGTVTESAGPKHSQKLKFDLT